MNDEPVLDSLLDRMRPRLEADLKLTLRALERSEDGDMGAMIAYHLGWQGERPSGGKRVRPMLSLLSCAAAGAPWEPALPLASAVELIHNFSLVHDDIQDQSATRHGRPTVWQRWGVAQAINVGDAIFVLARLAAHRLRDQGHEPAVVLAVMHTLDRACLRLTVGQHLDLAFEELDQISEAEYLHMIQGKTAALISAGTAAGAILALAEEGWIQALRHFGLHLGLAFQITDDILGIWGSPERTGKPAGDDLLARKKSYPVLHGLRTSSEFHRLWVEPELTSGHLAKMRDLLEQAGALSAAQELADFHTQQAMRALEAMPPTPYRAALRDFAARLLRRDR
jgi:geranylgeranyl diphosphate synthase type I